MAQRVTTTLIDDLDPALTADETIEFALDGKPYEIDLNQSHADRLRETLAQFVSAARRAGGTRKSTTYARNTSGKASSPATDRDEKQAIRTWARQNGFKVSDRGRIPADALDAYHTRQHTTHAKPPSSRLRKTSSPSAAEIAFRTAAQPAATGGSPMPRAPTGVSGSGSSTAAHAMCVGASRIVGGLL